jgi:hypothetical protein
MKRLLACLLAAGWLVTGIDAAQSRPIFTGTWKFVEDKSTPANKSALGDEIRITQEANALVLEAPITQFVSQPDGTSKLIVGGLGPAMVYKMDGEEHTPTRDPVRSSEVGFTLYYLSGGPYRVLWNGNTLVVAGSDQILYTSAGNMELVRRLLNTRLSQNPDGSLVVERIIERDPADKGRVEIKKATLRSVYRKTS